MKLDNSPYREGGSNTHISFNVGIETLRVDVPLLRQQIDELAEALRNTSAGDGVLSLLSAIWIAAEDQVRRERRDRIPSVR